MIKIVDSESFYYKAEGFITTTGVSYGSRWYVVRFSLGNNYFRDVTFNEKEMELIG